MLSAWSTAAKELPSGRDYKYHSAFRGFPRLMKSEAAVALEEASLVAKAYFGNTRRRERPDIVHALTSSGGNNSTQVHLAVMDTLDMLLEEVDHLLDEMKGQRMAADQQLEVTFGSGAVLLGAGTAEDFSSKVTRTLRPQLRFGDTALDNSYERAWVPWYFDVSTQQKVTCPANIHPFKDVVENHILSSNQLSVGSSEVYPPLDSTPLICVDTCEGLEAMIVELSKVNEIAVDLEHHSYHTFQGFTCLMQISTRTVDFIVDTLALRVELPRLATIFHNASIVKVLHGAQEDVRWLQRDFGLFVVNMFDTGLALQTLQRPRGLAFLVDHFCDVKLDKSFQTADWRVRPLSPAMLAYARQDTHYLLYCYDRLRTALLQAPATSAVGNLLVHTWNESRRLSLTVYTKPSFDPLSTWRDALDKSISGLSESQLKAAQALFNWRDGVARAEDESPPAVMTTKTLIMLSTQMPTNARDVLRIAQQPSVYLRKSAEAVAQLLCEVPQQTKDVAFYKAMMQEENSSTDTTNIPRNTTYRPMTGALPSSAGLLSAWESDDLVSLIMTNSGCAQQQQESIGIFCGVFVPPKVLVDLPGHPTPAALQKNRIVPVPQQPGFGNGNSVQVSKRARSVSPPHSKSHALQNSDKSATVTTAAENANTAEKGLLENEQLPPSLAEEFGGLGRATRRREVRVNRKK